MKKKKTVFFFYFVRHNHTKPIESNSFLARINISLALYISTLNVDILLSDKCIDPCIIKNAPVTNSF